MENAPFYFRYYSSNIDGIALPERFNFPFHYQPHTLAVIAAEELQHYLQTQADWQHDFGMDPNDGGDIVGKMFGVLVVRNAYGEMGYLCAVSGKLAGTNQHTLFVPPVFDILPEDGFFRKGEAVITELNERVQRLVQSKEYATARQALFDAQRTAEKEIAAMKKLHKQRQQARQQQRALINNNHLQASDDALLRSLNNESISDHYAFKQLKAQWKSTLHELQTRADAFQTETDALKEERKQKSAALQDEIFAHFSFVNNALERKSLREIFAPLTDGNPVAGAGECAAPKLLQYAFLNGLEPITMAEFWWGNSPKTEVRLHGHYYPACRGKCEPILGHMLQGMAMDENPLMQNPAEGKELTIVWEDEHIVIVHKPAEFLSVPGKKIDDSVMTRLKQRYPEATGPLVVHRLDMSTSGILLAAKSLEAYKALQQQFSEREIHKRYVAVLDGVIDRDEGWIDLPLRVDLENRPRQLVCYEYGKPAKTRWEVIERIDGKTRVYFYPITGRTHQLRVHAAHALGLHCPIVGDDLYGTSSTRLHLHAERIEFTHPVTGETVTVNVNPEF